MSHDDARQTNVGKGVIHMPAKGSGKGTTKGTSKPAAKAASQVLRDGRTGKASKTAAASALAQRKSGGKKK